MTSLAVAVAVAAAVLSLVVLARLGRQDDRVRTLTNRVDDLEADRRTSQARIDELEADNRDTTQALELALAAAAPADPPRDDAAADADISVITDISDRLRGVDGAEGDDDLDLTTARIASVTLGGPLIKVAAFSHGVRHALDEEQRMRISYVVRKEL